MKPRLSLVCTGCGNSYSVDQLRGTCEKCSGILEYVFDEGYLKSVALEGEVNLWRYKPLMPPVGRVVSLGEGGTPLQRSQRLAESLGLKDLFLKDETRNPTSSFKDRSASLIVSDAAGKGFGSIVCATNGNQGASLAAYAAKADLSCHLIVPKSLDIGKLAQMMVYDAQITEAGESVEVAIERAKVLEKEMGWYQATSELNPLSMEGLKTISYELIEQGTISDWVVVAMGSGVTVSALWKGFR